MQINGLISAAATTMPSTTAGFLAMAPGASAANILGVAPVGAVTPATGFTGLLNNKLNGTTNLTAATQLGMVDATVNSDNPTGDIIPSPQDINGIAIPPLSQYIDSPANKAAVRADSSDTEPTILALSKGQDGSRKQLSDEEFAELNKDSGKGIDISSLEPATGDEKVDQKLFADAVANIARHKNQPVKGETKSEPAPFEGTRIVSAAESEIDNEVAVATAEKETPKVAARLVSVKESDIDDLSKIETASGQQPVQQHKFGELDKHIKYQEVTTQTAQMQERTSVNDVHIKISQALNDGLSTIKIKLYPEELGQVDVDMEIDSKGNTSIRIIADRVEALDALRKDSAQLERALRDSGVRADTGSLEFSMRDQQQNQQNMFSLMQENQSRPNYSKFNGYNKQPATIEGTLHLSAANSGVNILA